MDDFEYAPGNQEGKNFGIALRRHHVARVKKARKGYWGRGRSWSMPELTPRQLGIVSTTSAMCSCLLCCSPRKSNGELTMQERGLFQALLQRE